MDGQVLRLEYVSMYCALEVNAGGQVRAEAAAMVRCDDCASPLRKVLV